MDADRTRYFYETFGQINEVRNTFEDQIEMTDIIRYIIYNQLQ